MYGFVITRLGLNYLTKLLAGSKLNITRVMVGSGKLPAGADPALMTELVQPVASATSTVPLVSGNVMSMVVEYRSDLNGGLDTGFWLNEFGVFVMDPDVGEILLYAGLLGDYPQFVSPYVAGSIDVRRFPIAIALTADVEIELDYPPVAWMTAQDVAYYFEHTAMATALDEASRLIAAHNIDPLAHPDIRAEFAGLDGRIGRVEEMLINDITGNPYMVTFEDLTGLNVTGVWNMSQQRIEF